MHFYVNLTNLLRLLGVYKEIYMNVSGKSINMSMYAYAMQL